MLHLHGQSYMWPRTLLQNEKPSSDQPKEMASGNSRSCRHLRRLLFFIGRGGTMVVYRERTTQQITEEANDWASPRQYHASNPVPDLLPRPPASPGRWFFF